MHNIDKCITLINNTMHCILQFLYTHKSSYIQVWSVNVLPGSVSHLMMIALLSSSVIFSLLTFVASSILGSWFLFDVWGCSSWRTESVCPLRGSWSSLSKPWWVNTIGESCLTCWGWTNLSSNSSRAAKAKVCAWNGGHQWRSQNEAVVPSSETYFLRFLLAIVSKRFPSIKSGNK